MPFKSEKQRRFLWAEHPEIAKRWAHEYPESNKNLPTYVKNKDDKDNKKAASSMPKNSNHFNVSSLLSEIEGRTYFPSPSILASEVNENSKKADSKQEKVDIARSEKPTYAGEEREKGMISSSVATGDNINESCGKNAINELLQKLSVVLAPSIQQTMENLEAEREGRVPVRVGRNRGLKQYPQATPTIPLPMGMQQPQQPAQPQQTQQAQQSKPTSPTPVGAGQSSATTDPIKFHSGLSASGIINGNAALSAPNTVNTKISSAENVETPAWLRSLMGAGVFGGAGLRSGALLGGLAGTAHGAFAQPGEYIDAQGKKQKQTRLQKVLHDALSGVGIGGLTGGIAGGVGGAALPFLPEKTSRDELQAALMSIDQPDPEYLLELLAERVKSAVEKWAGAGGGRAIGHALENEGVDPVVAGLAGLAAVGGLYGAYHGGKKLLAPVAKRLSVSTLPDDQIGPIALPTNPKQPNNRYTFAERYRQPSLLGSLFIDSDEDAISRAITQATKRNPDMLRRLEGQSGTPLDLDSIGKTLVNKYPHRYRLPEKVAMGFHEGPYSLGQFLFRHEPWTKTIGNITGKPIDNPGLGYTGAGGIGAGLGSLIGAYNAEKGKKLRGALRGGLIGAGTGLGARAAGGLAMSSLDNSMLNPQYAALAAALGGGVVGSAAGAGIADGVEEDLDAHKKTAAKRVLNLSPSWGGQKWQLGEWGLNPQAGYRYLGGVVPTPDIALRLGGPLGGTALGLAPFPYIETDWGRPSGRQANKETRSLYKWIGDGMRDRPTAAAHALADLPEDATAEDYEAAMRSSGVGYSAKELKRLAARMAKMGPLQLPTE